MKNYDKRAKLEQKQSNQYHSFEYAGDAKDWAFLYPSIELKSHFKKQNQIYFIRNVIRLIKEEFNTNFEELFKVREKQMDILMENNKKMKEIFDKLEIEGEFVKPYNNIISKVDNVLKILENEIKIKKFLTSEEKRKLEEERIKEEKRLAEIHADDSNIRALKMMMNNTLEEKKENILKKEIEKEDWMDKPKEEMTEQERIKFSEYLEKQEELK